MKNWSKIIFLFLIISFFPIYALATSNTSTTDTKLLLYTWVSEKWLINLWQFRAWDHQAFSGKIVNNSNEDLDIYLWFVDWVLDSNWQNAWCRNEWEWAEFWDYMTFQANWVQIQSWNKIRIPRNSSVELLFSFKTPGVYPYSGNLVWCITHYSTWASEDDCNFSLLSRKANFVNFSISGSKDLVSPIITTITYWTWMPQGWSQWYSENHRVKIPVATDIKIEFSKPMDKSKAWIIQIVPAPENLSYLAPDRNEDGTALYLHLNWHLKYDTDYTITITWAVDNYTWNPLTGQTQIKFSTIEKPADDQNQWWNQWGWWGWWGWWGGGWWWGWWGWWGGGWWWGGWAWNIDKPQKDNCPDWDFSSSFFDWSCGEYNEVEEDTHWSSDTVNRNCSIAGSEYSDELNQAYLYACNIWITTMPTIQQANMMWPLLRKHLAKMISEFSVKVLGIEPDKNKVCVFNDMDNESQEMKYFAQVSCQLWLMWLHSDWIMVKDSFDPNDPVTRAQFGTVLSRLLWWTTYATDDWQLYYVKHLQALKNNNIMTQIYGDWPNNIELRWRVMLMLMRVNENNLISHASAWTWYDTVNQWIMALIDDWNISVYMPDFEDGVKYSTVDFIPIKWSIDPSMPVASIYVTHYDSKWKWVYHDYKLSKFKPQDHDFVFYAYRYYNSMTVNDLNTYEFKFYDKDNKLLFKKTVMINHSYTSQW